MLTSYSALDGTEGVVSLESRGCERTVKSYIDGEEIVFTYILYDDTADKALTGAANMDSKFITFVTIFNILLCVHCYDDSSLRNMVQQWRQRNYVREMLRRLDDRMEQMGQDSRKVKRPCLLNLPGSDCDSMDTLGVAKDQGHWADEMGPGKRKRSNLEEQLSLRTQGLRKRPCSFNLPGTGCENYEIVGTAKDAGHWGSSVSPGRKRNSPIFENYEEE